MALLKDIQHILEKEEFECTYQTASEEIPLDHLWVFLGVDYQKREQLLEISAQEQHFVEETKPSHPYYRIQFSYVFPFKVEETALSQVSSLLLFLNHSMDFPGLELDELHNRLYYRYVWLVRQDTVDTYLILSLLGLIMLILELFTATVEHLALGKSTFNELLEEVSKLSKNL